MNSVSSENIKLSLLDSIDVRFGFFIITSLCVVFILVDSPLNVCFLFLEKRIVSDVIAEPALAGGALFGNGVREMTA